MKKYRLLSVVLLAALAALLFRALPVQGAPVDAKTEPVRLWVFYRPGTKGQLQRALHAMDAKIHHAFDDMNAFVVTLPGQAAAGGQFGGPQHAQSPLQMLTSRPEVVRIEEDVPRYFFGASPSAAQVVATATGSGQTVPYGVDMVQARDVWDANRDGVVDSGAPTGAGITVCIIDTGLYVDHEDFAGVNIVGGYSQVGDPWYEDGAGHGTHVAGTIAAANNKLGVVGVTPGAVNLYIVKVFDNNGNWTYSSDIVDAINRCANAGADIVSMSLGGSQYSSAEEQAFTNLYNQGILFVAAAGNDGTTAYSYPASYNAVISVAAVDSNGNVADFSQKNDQVELAAPGVGVLSTVPFKEVNQVTVNGVTYSANRIENAAYGTVSGPLVDGGLCDYVGNWSGAVVLCERGSISFYDKVMNVQNGGGVAALIYNNQPGNFQGTLGSGNTSSIPALSLSQEDGQYLVAYALGATAYVESAFYKPASGYAAWDGTSMATPHVSAVAALVWSAFPNLTNKDIRAALDATALDLGSPGRDTSYGYGLVQAYDAIQYLASSGGGGGGGGGTTPALHVSVRTNASWYFSGQRVYITATVTDDNGAPVSGATVDFTLNTANGRVYTASVSTNANGQATVTYRVSAWRDGSGTYTVQATASKNGYISGSGATTFYVIW